MPIPIILLADNDEVFLDVAREFLEIKGYHVTCATRPSQAMEILEHRSVALAILDFRLMNDSDDRDNSGLKLAQALTSLFSIPKIILTKFDRYEYAVQSLRPAKGGNAAAIDFVVKQEGLDRLLQAVEHALVKARIFLCYAHPDSQYVIQLYDYLATAGFVPWMDKKCIQGGEKWETAIRRAIRATDFFVACISNQSVNRRGFIQKEIRLALNIWDEKLEDDIYLIPVRLESCDIPYERLRQLQWVDIFHPDGSEKLVRAIQEGVRRRYHGT
jgi:CheY-like chemotaxis protein